MVDYVKLASMAKRLIDADGRSVTFTGNSGTPTVASKPWGAQTAAGEPLVTFAVFVPPSSIQQFGLAALGQGTQFEELVTFSDFVGIFFPGTTDIRQFSHVVDDTETFGITGLQILKPGDVQLLGFVGMRR
jgi:hypothetical protein